MQTPNSPAPRVPSREEAAKKQLLLDLVKYRDHLDSEVGPVTVRTREAAAYLTTQLSVQDQTQWLHGDQLFTAALSALKAIQKPGEVITGIPLVRFRAPLRTNVTLNANDRATRAPTSKAPFIATFETSEGRTLDVTAAPNRDGIRKRGEMVPPPLLKYVTTVSNQPQSVLPPIPVGMKEALGSDLERCMLGFWYAFFSGNAFVPFARIGELYADTLLHSFQGCVIPPFEPLTQGPSSFRGTVHEEAHRNPKGLLKATGHTDLKQGENKLGEGNTSFVFVDPAQMKLIEKTTIRR